MHVEDNFSVCVAYVCNAFTLRIVVVVAVYFLSSSLIRRDANVCIYAKED